MSKNTLAQPCAWLNHFSSNHGNGNIWVPQTPRHVLLFIVSLLKTHFIFSGSADKPSVRPHRGDNRGNARFL